MLSIVHSKAHNGLYVGGEFSQARANGADPAVNMKKVGFWSFETQRWQPLGTATANGVTSSSVATFQESANGETVYVSARYDSLQRFDWASKSWTRIANINYHAMQLLPDQQRLIAMGNSEDIGLQLLDLSSADPSPKRLMSVVSPPHQTVAQHASGVYTGFSYVQGEYRHAARLVVPDMDGDGIANEADNCPLVPNQNQANRDADAFGDACDDIDGDGVLNNIDNCPLTPNNEQVDSDQDDHGDACDAFPADPTEWLDSDGDGIGDNSDICPTDASHNCLNNPNGDFDGDGHNNGIDICPEDELDNCLANPNGDFDGDGRNNDVDAFPADPTEWLDSDGDGIGDNSDLCPTDASNNCLNNPNGDFDGDGRNNDVDAFPEDFTEWLDSDGDGIGDNSDLCPSEAENNCLNNPAGDFDGDDHNNGVDAFPEDPSRWFDRDLSDAIQGNAAKQYFGQVLANVGDVNNDGVADYAIGTPNFTATITVNSKTKKLAKAGRVQVFSGFDDALLWQRSGEAKGEQLGSAIIGVDLNGDQRHEVIVGAPGANKQRGAVRICINENAGSTAANTLNCRERLISASVNGARFGSSLAAHSNGQQLFVGAPKDINVDNLQPTGNLLQLWQYSQSKKRVGAVYVYAADKLVGQQSSIFPENRLYGAQTNSEFGSSLAWLTSTDQLAIGAPKARKTGQVLRWNIAAEQYQLLSGKTTAENFGRVVSMGQLSNDTEHLIVAAPLAANGKLKKAGRVEIFAANDGAWTHVDEFNGQLAGGEFGAAITAAVVDTSGSAKLAIASPKATLAKELSTSGKPLKRAGLVQLFALNNAVALDQKRGEQANTLFGTSVAAGDLTGDNLQDVLVGVIGANHPTDKKLKAAGQVQFIDARDWPQ